MLQSKSLSLAAIVKFCVLYHTRLVLRDASLHRKLSGTKAREFSSLECVSLRLQGSQDRNADAPYATASSHSYDTHGSLASTIPR